MFSMLSKIKWLAPTPEVDDVCPVPQRTLAQALRDGPVERRVHFRSSAAIDNASTPRPLAPSPASSPAASAFPAIYGRPHHDEEGLEMARIEIISVEEECAELDEVRVLQEDQKACADRGIEPPSPTASIHSTTQGSRNSTMQSARYSATQSFRKGYAFTYSA